MALTSPRRIAQHTLDALENWRINEKTLDYRAKLDPDWPVDLPAYEGMVAHLSNAGMLLPGVGNLDVMPLFLRNNEFDADVNNYGGDPETEKGAFVPVGPTGVFNTLVATGGFELLSTEYTGDDDTFLPNVPLTSPTTTSNAGKLAVGTKGTHTLCGIVSRGIIDNPQKKATGVAFWSWLMWKPA